MKKISKRFKIPKTDQEEYLREMGFEAVCGVDEVGRGAWAGPLVAAAVVLPPASRKYKVLRDSRNLQSKYKVESRKWEKDIRDSKMLPAKERERLNLLIRKRCRFGIGEVSVKELEKHKMTKGTQLAFRRAIENLGVKVDYALVDGTIPLSPCRERRGLSRIGSRGIIKGDMKCLSIAAASIVAKVYRDNLMVEMNDMHPGYNFHIHKGYGTKLHQNALKIKGKCTEHRRFYRIKKYS